MFTLFPIVLLFSRSFPALMIAFFIRGLKEFGDTSRKALIVSYSEPERRGQMIGAYYLIRDSIVSVGAILGAYLWSRSPAGQFSRRRPHLALSEQSFTSGQPVTLGEGRVRISN
jgi:MFS family permease